jgi:hypothetical protein
MGLRFFVLDPEVDETVGGKVQCAVIDKGGFRTMRFSFTSDPEDPGTWQEMSPKEGELETFLPRIRRDKKPSSDAPLEVYQVMS